MFRVVNVFPPTIKQEALFLNRRIVDLTNLNIDSISVIDDAKKVERTVKTAQLTLGGILNVGSSFKVTQLRSNLFINLLY